MTETPRRRGAVPRRAAAIVAVGVLTSLCTLTPASAEPVTSGGCQEFGQNVAGLARSLGPAFGALASSVASSGPRAFPTIVVHPEQAAFCP